MSNAADYTTVKREDGRALMKRVLVVVGIAVGCAAVCLPLDGPVAEFCRRFQPGGDLRLGGDFKREIEFVQQFGGFTSLVITAVFIWLLDPANRMRLRQLVLAVIVHAAVVNIFKMTIGRPRPKFGESLIFTLPWQTFPLPIDGVEQPRHAWEFWRGISSNLWSMPSSHTSAAFVLAVFLATVYPRCRWFVFGLAGVVAVCRVVLGAHYPSDVVVGAGLGYAAATLAMARSGKRAAVI
jgi:membrane-associated phospholipid phosphatase